MKKIGLFFVFYHNCSCSCLPNVINLLSPVPRQYGKYLWMGAVSHEAVDTAPIHRYLSVLHEQTGDNYIVFCNTC